MPVTEVNEGDTHPIWFTVRDKTGTPLDISGATAVAWAKRRGHAAVPLALAVDGDPLQGRWKHDLTGTLEASTYLVQVKMTKAGVQTTVPTSEGGECLKVNPTYGASS